MKTTIIKPLLGAIVVAVGFNGAQAASLALVDHLGYGAYSSVTGSTFESDMSIDLSAPPADVALFGASAFETPAGAGTLLHSYSADAYLDFSGAQTSLWMSASHSLAAGGDAPFTVESHQQDVGLDLSAVNMRVVGGAGEAAGSTVLISFIGNANGSALADFGSVVSGGYLAMGMSVSRGNEVLGEYFWDLPSGGVQDIRFSFASHVGETVTLSAFILSGAGLQNASFSASANPVTLGEGFGSLVGSFAVAAVPEPETFALLLAGLGVLGYQVRRRPRQVG